MDNTTVFGTVDSGSNPDGTTKYEYLKALTEDEGKMKVITICGSLKFENDIKYHTERLELEGNCVLGIIFLTKDKSKYNEEQFRLLGEAHHKKIELSDAIFVVNKNNYTGESVRKEIEFAKKLKKEILYLE